MALEDFLPTLAENLAAVTGIEAVYFPHPTDADAGLPGTLQIFPCLVLLPEKGPLQMMSAGGPNTAIHELRLTLFVTQQILPEAYNVATPFIKLIRNKLASHIMLSGLSGIDHVLPSSRNDFYEGPGTIKYGDKDLIGIIFHIEVKEHETFTVAA